MTSDGDGNPLLPVTRRHLAPPSTVPQLVERHGLFDAAFGSQATAQARDRMLALASRESGAFSDPVVPRPGGGTMPAPGLTVVDPAGSPATLPLPPGQPLPAGQYLVHDTDNPVVPYLIDPGARGATLTPVHGEPVTAGSAPATVAYSGQWPDQVPAELRLVAGGPAGQGRSPVLAADPAGRGTVTVTLPPASEARRCSARRSPPPRWT